MRKVVCIQGHENLLKEGDIYTVRKITSGGNFILEETDVPEGYTSFSSERFIPVQGEGDWTMEMEEDYWEAQA